MAAAFMAVRNARGRRNVGPSKEVRDAMRSALVAARMQPAHARRASWRSLRLCGAAVPCAETCVRR